MCPYQIFLFVFLKNKQVVTKLASVCVLVNMKKKIILNVDFVPPFVKIMTRYVNDDDLYLILALSHGFIFRQECAPHHGNTSLLL